MLVHDIYYNWCPRVHYAVHVWTLHSRGISLTIHKHDIHSEYSSKYINNSSGVYEEKVATKLELKRCKRVCIIIGSYLNI